MSLAGGNSVVGKPAGVACNLRARGTSIAHGRAIAAPYSARVQLARLRRAPGPWVVRDSWSRTDARCRVRARCRTSPATACCCRFVAASAARFAVCCPLLAVVRGPAMGGIETRIRAVTGLPRVFIYPPSLRKMSERPMCLRGASPRALSADPGLMPLRGSCGRSQLRRALSSAHCGHLDGLRRSTEARAKRVSQTQPRGAAAPRETGGQFRPKHRRVHRCRDRPRRLGGHHASAVDGARVTTTGGGALGQRRGD